MSTRRGGRPSRRSSRSTTPSYERTLRVSQLINVALGDAEMPDLDGAPSALVTDDGEVLTRAQAAAALVQIAQFSSLCAAALPDEERTELRDSIGRIFVDAEAQIILEREFGPLLGGQCLES